MRRAGVDRSVIKEITGHATEEMFDRYNTVDIHDTVQAVDQLRAISQMLTKTLTKPQMSEGMQTGKAW